VLDNVGPSVSKAQGLRGQDFVDNRQCTSSNASICNDASKKDLVCGFLTPCGYSVIRLVLHAIIDHAVAPCHAMTCLWCHTACSSLDLTCRSTGSPCRGPRIDDTPGTMWVISNLVRHVCMISMPVRQTGVGAAFTRMLSNLLMVSVVLRMDC